MTVFRSTGKLTYRGIKSPNQCLKLTSLPLGDLSRRYRLLMNRTIFLIALLLFATQTFASQEGALAFENFEINSRGIGESGPILIIGKTNSNGKYESIIVKAFNRSIPIEKSVLDQIPFNSQNGILLTYESGYKLLGGKTLYIQFQFGFTSGLIQKFIVSVNEEGAVNVLE